MRNMSVFKLFLAACLALSSSLVLASDFEQPAAFKQFDPTSKFKIKYNDLDILYDNLVVDVGRSKREKAAPQQAKLGTRMKVTVNRSTVNEGNRFFYEGVKKDDELRDLLEKVQGDIERIPGDISLEYFTRDEQLAYWLNLFNITMINQVVKVYPKRSLKKLLVGRKSIMDDKILEVAGVPLSLNDIQYGILQENYADQPLVMYGLYYGIIGGPNIRKRAYTGDNVWRYLEDNARDFINSNRGTYSRDERVFNVSSLYERNAGWFDNLDSALKDHLMAFITGPERRELEAASGLRTNIDEWTVTDVYGTSDTIGGSFADSRVALLDSVRSEQVSAADGSSISTAFSVASSTMVQKAPQINRYSPNTLEFMQEIKRREQEANMEKGTVTVEELGEAPAEAEPKTEKKEGGEG
jgi:hypothetical protein